METSITCRDLAKQITGSGGKYLLKGISFDVQRNGFCVLAGKNGSGKSTLLKCLAGITLPSEGRVSLLGLDPFRQRKVAMRRSGILFSQKSMLLADLPPADSIDFLSAIYHLDNNSREETLDFVETRLPFKHLLTKNIRKLSFGERMRCEIASILLHRPELVILDEPLIGLDPQAQDRLVQLLFDYRKVFGATVLLSTHQYLPRLLEADQALVLSGGSIVYEGVLSRLLGGSGERIYARFLKEPSRRADFSWEPLPNDAWEIDFLASGLSAQEAIADLATLPGVLELSIRRASIDSFLRSAYVDS